MKNRKFFSIKFSKKLAYKEELCTKRISQSGEELPQIKNRNFSQ